MHKIKTNHKAKYQTNSKFLFSTNRAQHYGFLSHHLLKFLKTMNTSVESIL